MSQSFGVRANANVNVENGNEISQPLERTV